MEGERGIRLEVEEEQRGAKVREKKEEAAELTDRAEVDKGNKVRAIASIPLIH